MESGAGNESVRLKAIQAVAEFADQVKLDVVQAPTDKAEAELVVHQIEQMVGGTSYFSLDSGRVEGAEQIAARSFADFAVLYRLGTQSRLLIEAFERSGIPYQTVGQIPLYAHKPVREILAFLWFMHTPQSRVHLETVLEAVAVTLPEKTLQELADLAGTQGGFPVEAFEKISQTPEVGIPPLFNRRRTTKTAGCACGILVRTRSIGTSRPAGGAISRAGAWVPLNPTRGDTGCHRDPASAPARAARRTLWQRPGRLFGIDCIAE